MSKQVPHFCDVSYIVVCKGSIRDELLKLPVEHKSNFFVILECYITKFGKCTLDKISEFNYETYLRNN